MGKTSLDLWSVLLREALQNSWDARLAERIEFHVADTRLSEEQSGILVHDLFNELPPQGASRGIPQKVNNGRIRVLTISDYGTKGLGGPIRANVEPEPGERDDFSDFVRNFGRSDSKGLEGGTYGYGKGVLYQASQVGVCLVYSQAKVNGRLENRLIGVSGGDNGYVDNGFKFTGRNWWGVLAEDGVIDPATGPEARAIAESVGMPVPAHDETGTCIMILAPHFFQGEAGDVGPKDRITAIRAAAVKWAWPHAVDIGEGPNVGFAFSYDGEFLPSIEPFKEPSVKHFAHAYADMERAASSKRAPLAPQTKLEVIMSQNPIFRLGTLSMRQAINHISDDRALQNTVALMRNPRIVVKYLAVAAPVDDYSVYSVFLADPEVDEDFATSEPVTHDDWIVKDAMTRGNRNFVRIALNRIENTFKNMHRPSAPSTAAQQAAGATRIATALGGLVGGISGHGAASQPGKGPGPGGGASRSRRAAARLTSPPRLLVLGGIAHVAFSYSLTGGKSGELFDLSVRAHVVTVTGAIEGDAPLGAEGPQFVGWKVDGQLVKEPSIRVVAQSQQEYLAIFTQPDDTAISSTVDLKLVSP
ncbi:hypothetical protein HP499_05080 [Paenarthrobacter sp. CM16]|uniref:hypothetical protein n=1 Tax=Paenarthrobacter sp. CM16 TaxID=2738447 RepID=UPI00155404F8|nr:hypothetical protein [Paenarthrobacter sp. CM16]NQD87181.1 hypothetical protein [Paenarthrobacter sp. CM16]